MARFNELSREKRNCLDCAVAVTSCKLPHSRPVTTISREFGLIPATVSQDIKACREHWKRYHLDPQTVQAETDITLQRLEEIRNECLAEWQRSKMPMTTTESEASSIAIESGSVSGQRNKARKIVKEQTGSTAYMNVLLAVESQRSEIYGMAAPKKLTATDTEGNDVFKFMAGLARQALKNVVDLPAIDITPAEVLVLPEPPSDDVDAILREIENEP